MSSDPEMELLEKEIQSSIDTLKNKAKKNKERTKYINVLSVSLGAIITLTLGLDITEGYEDSQKNIALFFGAVLTVVNGWNALFDYKKLWIRQKSTLLHLYQLRNELAFRKASNECQVTDLFEKYQHIWEKDGEEWRSILRSSSSLLKTTKNKK